MLIGDRFDALRANRLRQRGDLRRIQIVGRRQAGQTKFQIRLRGERISSVEAEIAR